MGENSSGNALHKLVSWFGKRDLRTPIAMGAIGLVVASSLAIVGIAYAESGGGLFAASSSGGSLTPKDSVPPQDSATVTDPTGKPGATDEPVPGKTEAPAPKPSEKPADQPVDKPKPPPAPLDGYIPESLDQIMAAVNAYRAGQGLAPYGELADNCEKIDYAWSDASPGGRLSTQLIAENPGPLSRTVAAPHWMAVWPYWTDDGSTGGIPAVKIKVYECHAKVVPPSEPTPPPTPSPSPSSTESTG
jgi:hypothetical protein